MEDWITSHKLPFGKFTLPAERAKKAAGKGLLIAGVRPEHFEDAKVVDSSVAGRGATFRATVDVVEWLGNEAYAYIPFEAPPEVSAQLADLKSQGEALEGAASASDEELRTLLQNIPNLPQDSVPVGSDEHSNAVVKVWDKIERDREYTPEKPAFTPLDHVALFSGPSRGHGPS